MNILELQNRVEELAEHLQTASNIYADTRVPWGSLYDHLALTAALAVGMVSELWNRGWTAKDICGLELSKEELQALARICGLTHDVGKARLGGTEYRWHVQRGREYMEGWLLEQGVPEPLCKVILGTIERHHLSNNPLTPLEKVVCLADSCASAGDRPELARAETWPEFERATQATGKLEQELFGDTAPVCLLLGDVDAIKAYVYETQVLPEIRGGSELLQEVEEEIRGLFQENLAKECLVYCGGGSFLGIVPASNAREWKNRLEALYLRITRVATVTVVISKPLWYADLARGLRPYTLEEVRKLKGQGVAEDLLLSHFGTKDRAQRKNFGELVADLTGKLQQAKRRRDFAPFMETLPIFGRCQSCGKRMAEAWDSTREEWICNVCRQKRDKGRQRKRETVRRFGDWLKAKGITIKPELPEDLNALAKEEGRIALLYADGNNMGELLQRALSPAAYRHISDALKTATQEALFEALWETFGQKGLAGDALPFEIIALGGDDVVVITSAGAGWALTVNVLERFATHQKIRKLEGEFRERLGADSLKLSMSAGLAIADVKYPIRFLFDLVEGLLRKAKRLARDQQTGTLAHLWLRTPVVSENAEDILENLYRRERNGLECWLSARPYTVKEARELHRLAGELEKVPSSFCQALAESLEKGIYVSLNYALYQAARVRKEHCATLWEVFESLGRLVSDSNASARGLLFWRETEAPTKWPGRAWCTAFLDVLELTKLGVHQYPIVGGCP